MTAELITTDPEILEEQMPVVDVVAGEAVVDEADDEQKVIDTGANAKQRSAIRAIYGTDPEKTVECLTSDEAVMLLNQAARIYLQRVPESRRQQVLSALAIMRDFTHGLDVQAVAEKHQRTWVTTNRIKNDMYHSLKRTVQDEIKAGTPVMTPLGLVEQKAAPALEKVATLGPRDVSDWMVRGLCGYMPAERFDVPKEYKAGVNLAKAMCRRCVVREMCLEDALQNGSTGGVRAGMTESELKAQRRKRR